MWNEERGATLLFLRSKQGGAWWKDFPNVHDGKDHHPLAVRGSVPHSKFIKKNPTRNSNVSKFYYFIFI
jgi:hypothetical protein